MAARSGKKSSPANASQSDIARLKSISRKMLINLEKIIEDMMSGVYHGVQERPKEQEWIFGNKTSLATTLCMLAELMLKLDAAERASPAGKEGVAPDDGALCASDLALVRSFIGGLNEPSAAPV